MNSPPRLQVHGLKHRFDRSEVLKGIDIDLYPGEVHAVSGDHGSGKSTLVRLLGGMLQCQSGTILIDGKRVSIDSPSRAIENGIGIVHQKQRMLLHASLLDNIYLGKHPFFLFPKRKQQLLDECQQIFSMYGFDESPLQKSYRLDPAKRQLFSLIRLLANNANIIILDEIAQKTTPKIQEQIYSIIRQVQAEGKSVLYVTSNIDEIFTIADRVSILQNGHRRATEVVSRVDRSRLVHLAFNFLSDQEEHPAQDQHEMLMISRYDKRILDDIPQGLVIISPDNSVQNINKAACRLLQLEESELKDLGIEQLVQILPLERVDELAKALYSRKKKLWQELRYGTSGYLKLRISPLGEQDAREQGVLLFIEDAAGDVETREYLEQAEKYASTAELAAGVAHEVNNPLGIIQNYLDLLDLEELQPDAASYVQQIQKELSRIVEIISSLLSFSRVGKRPLRPVIIPDLLDEVLLLMSHKLKSKAVTVKRSYESSSLMLEAHENKLKQLFINLLNNAYDAVLKNGQIKISVRPLSVSSSDDYIEILIQDNGYGIPSEIQEQIFNPFYSTKVTKTNTGLGLSICQHIVESYGGVITLESDPGEKTVFFIRLPRNQRSKTSI